MNYEKKYLKYKMKYLELKNQIGGIPGYGECNFLIHNAKNANAALTNKCPLDVIKEFSKIDKTDIISKMSKDQLLSLKEKFITAKYTEKEFKEAGFTIAQLFNNFKYSLKELKGFGYSCKELSYAGFKAVYLKEVCNSRELRNIGISANLMKEMGYKCDQLVGQGGYSLNDLKEAGFKLPYFVHLFTIDQLTAADYKQDYITQSWEDRRSLIKNFKIKEDEKYI